MRRRVTAWLLVLGMMASLMGGAFAAPFVASAPVASAMHCPMPAESSVQAPSCCCSGKTDASPGNDTAVVAVAVEKAGCACTMQPAPPLPPDPAPFAAVRTTELAAILPLTVRVMHAPLLGRAVSPNVGFLSPPVRFLSYAPDIGRAPPF